MQLLKQLLLGGRSDMCYNHMAKMHDKKRASPSQECWPVPRHTARILCRSH
jgi:hypothetical protein